MKKGTLFVVSGPSGCGKGTILHEVLQNPNLYYSVSATTREMRPGEVDGVNYQFLTNAAFEALIANDGILEYAQYCNHYYGTPKQPVEDHLAQGQDVILEIEVVGAMKIREKCPDAVFLFIMPPSLSELERRLRKRGTEEGAVVQNRVAQASREIGCAAQYDYIVVNGELSQAIADVNAILRAESCKTEKCQTLIEEVLGK
ncbi:guanylate kinase [Ruminococcus sp.]|uniref:guanylate kinase n=1 Tax=Ruminococcus sp. TaxID=41978 RepID=UPI0025F842FC|nr:guanylate kinase [Ruminococcus sp.]